MGARPTSNVKSSRSAMRVRLACKLRDTTGSSIILALAFFIICAIVGAIVLTAASVNTKATITYEETQQAEYTVTSAADFLGGCLSGAGVVWKYPEGSEAPDFSDRMSYADEDGLMTELWDKYGSKIWDSYKKNSGFSIDDTFTISVDGFDTVYARISFDADLNVVARLSLASEADAVGNYDELVNVQATPHFDNAGKLIAVDWNGYTVVKAASASDPASVSSRGGATS